MFTDYATELNTPAGVLTVMGKDGLPLPFDKDVLCISKTAGISFIDLHIDLNLFPPREEQTVYLKNAPVTGWEQAGNGFIWLKTLVDGKTMAISVLDPSTAHPGFSIVEDKVRVSLAKAPLENGALSIIANDPAPDTFLQITVAWGNSNALAKLALQHIMANQR